MFLRLATLVSLLTAAMPAQVVITAQNAAAWNAGVPVNAAAPGSIVAIQMLRGGPVPINPDISRLAVQVRPAGAAAPLDAPVLGASIGTVLALLPRNLPPGSADVTLVNDGQPSTAATIAIAATAPGLFAEGSNGLGSALAQNARPGSVTLNQLTEPALPGDYLTLWGTGLGDAAEGEIMVEVGGISVQPDYAGPAPGYPGLDQINVALPAAAPVGCYVSVLVRARDAVSNEVTVSTAAEADACEHPLGLSAQQLKDLDEGRNARLVVATIRADLAAAPGPSPNIEYTRNDSFSADFSSRMALDLALLSQPLLTDERYFSCKLQNAATLARFLGVDDTDAGESLTLTGPGANVTVPKSLVPVLYTVQTQDAGPVTDPRTLPQSFFSPGPWTLAGPGGGTLGSFQAELTLPPPIRWTNRQDLGDIDRSRGVLVTWQPDGYGADAVLTVTLSTGYFTTALPAPALATGISCRAPATAGQLYIPPDLLGRIPPSPSLLAPAATLQLRLAPRPTRRTRFEVPELSGGTRPAIFDYAFSESLRTNIR